MRNILYFSTTFIASIFALYFFYYQANIDKITKNIYLEKSNSIKDLLQKEITSKQETTKIFSYLISQDKKIIDALKTDTKDKINFDNVIGFLHENVSYKNLWLQIISKDGKTIYRSWTSKQDDSLLSFDDAVKDAIKSKRPIQSISSSEFDLTFNSLQAIYENDELVGFIKLISHFNSIAKVLKEQKIEPLFLLSEEKSNLIKEPFTKKFLEKNYIANLNASEKIIDLVKKDGISDFENINNFKNFSNYIVTNIKIDDGKNNNLAQFLMFTNKKDLDLQELSNFKNNYLKIVVIFIIIYTLAFLYFLKLIYAKKLQKEVILKTEKIKSLLTIYDENVIFCKTNLEKVITHASSAFCKISAYTKDELIGKSYNILTHPEISKDVFEDLWKNLKEKKRVSLELKNLRKDGSYYWVIADFEPDYNENGEHIGYFAIKKDITANKDIEKIQRDMIFTLGSIAEFRSKDTGEHVKRVAKYSKVLAKAYGLSQKDVQILEMASPMHDIGKIAIPDKILNKPGELTPSEYEIIKTHAQKGYDMLQVSNRELFKVASQIALTHHERYDGTGYPNGLKGEEIPIFGRITAIADVFDAIGSERCYKKAWDLNEVLKYIKDNSGTHFDPKLVQLCFDNIDKILEIREKYQDKN